MGKIIAVFGWIRAHWGSMSQLIIGLFALILALRPKAVAELEEKPIWKVSIPLVVGLIAISGFVSSLSGETELKDQIHSLLLNQQIVATKNDLTILGDRLVAGLDGVVDELKTLESAKPQQHPNKLPVTPPVATSVPPITLGPSIVQSVQVSQRRTESTNPNEPYALQVIIATNVATQPTAFMIECNGDIDDGTFFVAGSSVLMGMGYGVQPDKRRFFLSFQYPQFAPDSPIVVTLLSKNDIRVISVAKAR